MAKATEKFHPNGDPILEFPKLLYLASGDRVVVNNEKEEAEALKDEPVKEEKEEVSKDPKKKW